METTYDWITNVGCWHKNMLYSTKINCRITPPPPHNGHLSTTATFLCPQVSRCGEVQMYHYYYYCERFEPSSHFKRLSLIVRVSVVLNRTVVVDSD